MSANDHVIFLSNVRLSFPHIAEPQRGVNETTGIERVNYNAEFIMAPDHAGFQAFMKKVSEMALEKWKEHAAAVLNLVNQDRKKRCYGAGSEKVNQRTFTLYDGYEGSVFITAGRNIMPQIIQKDGKPIDPANTGACIQVARTLYGGCRVNAAVKPWVQDNKHGKGVRCDFVAIQFASDDTAFGEGVIDASEHFAPVAAPQGAAPATPGFAFPGAPGLPRFLQ